jgi:RNA polymerase sigma factor (sigma-70 family)
MEGVCRPYKATDMAINQISDLIHHLRRMVSPRDGAGLTDGQLLEDYISRRDEAALAALVRRHGAMVWGVCQRVLRNYHDAEDAFQATFLVLVRKAASIASAELVANWLFGVAHQTALKARATAAKSGARERQVTQMPEPPASEPDLWNDVQLLLDHELSRLTDKYRVAIVLCDLEGKTRKEVARQLGVPEGTVGARLARGRALLAKRLARHGLAVSGGALGAMLAQNAAAACVPSSVVSITIQAALFFAARQAAATVMVSARVAALTQGVLKTMVSTKLRTALAVVLVVGLVGFGHTWVTYYSAAGQPAKAAANAAPDPKPAAAAPRTASAPAPAELSLRDTDPVKDPGPELKSGQKLEGEIDLKTNEGNPGGEGFTVGYRVVVPITLKAGANVSASATVVGANRKVGLLLKDPTGKTLGSSKMDPRTARLNVWEVNATGKYTIHVYSDLIGPYTLWVADTMDELDKKALEEQISRLEKELAVLREKLKAKEKEKPQ